MTTQLPSRSNPSVEDLIRRVERIERRLGMEVTQAPPAPPVSHGLAAPIAPAREQAPPPGASAGEVGVGAGAPAIAPVATPGAVPIEPPPLAAGRGPTASGRAMPPEAARAKLKVLETLARETRAARAAAWGEGRNLESLIGGRWFGVAGAVIILIGVGLFLKFAYDEGWIGPAGQCLAVAGFGVALLGAGEFVRRRIGRVASIGPSAAGLGALFFAAFAAHEVFQPPVVTLEVALGLVAGVTALGVGLGVLTRLASLVAVAMVGGYIAPVLLGSIRPSELFMPSYLLALLVVGAGTSALFSASPDARRFRVLRSLGWWGTGVLGTVWLGATGLRVPPNGLLFVAGAWVVVHAELLLASYAPVRVRPELVEEGERGDVPGLWRARWIIGSFATSAWAAVFGVLLMLRLDPALDWAGTAGVGALCAAAAGLALTLDPIPDVLRRGARTAREQLGAGLLAQTGALVIATVALALGGWVQVVAWLALGWAAVGAGRWIRSAALDVYGLIVLSIGAARLIVLDLPGAFDGPVWWTVGGLAITSWTGQMGLAAAAWIGAGALILSGGRRAWRPIGVGALCVACVLLALALLHAQSVGGALSVWWCAVGVGAVAAGRWRRLDGLTECGSAMLAIGAMKLLTQDIVPAFDAAPLLRPAGLLLTVWSGQVVLAALAMIAATILLPRDARRWTLAIPRFMMVGALSLLALAPTHAGTDCGAATLWCAALAIAATTAHRADRRLGLDVMGIGLIVGATVPWMLAYVRGGWAPVEAAPGLHPGLGVALVLVVCAGVFGLLMKRGQDRESDRWAVGVLALIYAGGLLFAATSLEVGRVASIAFAGDATSRAAVLSIWWGIYGVALLGLGFARRTAPLRYVGLALIALAAVKAVVFDLAQVSEGWRVASFIGLGLLMIGVAVGYAMLSRLLSDPREEDGGGVGAAG